MRFHPSRYAVLIRDYFHRESAPETPDVLLDVRIGRWAIEAEIQDSLFVSKVLKKKGFYMSGGLIRGRYDRDARQGTIRMHEALIEKPTIRVFEQLLYQAFYSVNPAGQGDAYLIHSCGVIHGGRGYLFAGPPESGKSTVARLSLPDRVLNDEINIICSSEEKVEICSTPFNGLFEEKTEGRCELKAVLLLRQSPTHKLTEVDGAEAVKTLVREIVPPIGLDEVITPAVREYMLDMAIRIKKSVPVYRLEFRLNRGFWDLIDREIHGKGG
jgi:hypothetical protein